MWWVPVAHARAHMNDRVFWGVLTTVVNMRPSTLHFGFRLVTISQTRAVSDFFASSLRIAWRGRVDYELHLSPV